MVRIADFESVHVGSNPTSCAMFMRGIRCMVHSWPRLLHKAQDRNLVSFSKLVGWERFESFNPPYFIGKV